MFTILDNLHGAIVIADEEEGDVTYHNIQFQGLVEQFTNIDVADLDIEHKKDMLLKKIFVECNPKEELGDGGVKSSKI